MKVFYDYSMFLCRLNLDNFTLLNIHNRKRFISVFRGQLDAEVFFDDDK